MKKCIILLGAHSPSGELFTEEMNQYVSSMTYVLKRYSDIAVVIKNGVLSCVCLDDGSDIADYDLMYLRGKTCEPVRHVLALYAGIAHVPVVNSESNTFQVMTKIEQYAALAVAGVPVPDSVFVAHPQYYDRIPQLLGSDFPMVAKSISGSNGNDNMLVHTSDELRTIPISDPVFQPFLPNEFDYRVIVAGDHVALAYKRIRGVTSADYKNNIAKGGRREMVELPDDIAAIAVKTARVVGREFGGVDVLPRTDNGQAVVLEINFNFGTPHFDDVAQKEAYYRDVDTYFNGLTNESL